MDSPSDAQLARVILRSLAAVVALTLAGGIASAAGRLSDGSDETAADVVVDTGALSPRGGLGPLPGTSVSTYIGAAAAELADAAGPRAAVVSFAGYRTPEQARALVDGTEVVSWLVALPGGRSQQLAPDRDVAAWVRGQQDEAAAEKQAIERLLPTVEDPDFRREYQADVDRLTAVLAVGRERRDLVFGALVVGSASRLRTIGALTDVRMVDVDGDATPPSSTSSSAGVRPEETIEAGEPPTRPAD